MPLVKKIIGKETLESIEKSIESDVWNRLKINLAAVGYDKGYPSEIIILAFKEEQKLQIYSKDSIGIKLIKTYPFTSYSGKLGPKLKEGDKQIPEGIYEVEYLNPNSSYYLSIKINYPNSFDRSKSKYTDHSKMGGDIFIHGNQQQLDVYQLETKQLKKFFY